jgi:hypothetical protein
MRVSMKFEDMNEAQRAKWLALLFSPVMQGN